MGDLVQLPAASTFTSQAAAEQATARNISANTAKIRKWLDGSDATLAINDKLDPTAGRVYVRAMHAFVHPTGVRTVLLRTPTGYTILTSFPTP